MSLYDFRFDGQIDKHDFGRMAYTVVYLPEQMRSLLPLKEHPRLRIDGEVAGIPVHGALQPSGSGQHYLMLSRKFLREARLGHGDHVTVEFSIADQHAVEVPDELQHALNANDRANAAWNSLTAGKRRGFAYRVGSAKRPETRERRVDEVLDALREINSDDDATR